VRRLVSLRDQDWDRRVALEAAKVLAAYSDGAPGAGNIPEVDPEEVDPEEEARILALLQPPELGVP
jgi:hypothetical protein